LQVFTAQIVLRFLRTLYHFCSFGSAVA
jgi:hypothetical protein